MPYTKLSTTDTQGSLSPSLSPKIDQSPENYARDQIDDPDKILSVNLTQHHGDADKLFLIARDLQELGIKQQTEILRLKEIANLTKSQSTSSSRRNTDNSDYSLKKGFGDQRIGIAITYDPSDNILAVRSREAMKGLKYTEAPLPPFHWWTDTLHIYFGKNKDPKKSGPDVQIVAKKLPDSSKYNFIRTIKLGQLGCGVVRRRLQGSLDVIYVLSPES